MDKNALFNLTYGVFMVSVKSEDCINGCITNTCIQVANSPIRVAISVLNSNYTCELLNENDCFTLSLLDESCTYEIIKHFGMQSGRDVDKFEGMDLKTDINGLPYITDGACAVISCKVVSRENLGSHTLFVGEVVDAEVLSDKSPLTYADYRNRIKPKSQDVSSSKKIVGWRCKICNYVYEGSELPDDYLCPLCGHGKDDFEPIYE
ncbi:MAG: flavin reductase [Lachnospiraceae bacterium]|nr:flavin reductase [Lachnospiraceae bacterium]